eukprot:TRINITY_DN7517_c0_g1_i1.p1 TRINITY_DN7517_c0_g1~~TRINITY_DN7517_c0_g1_i1.p1  ORF type:complete len:174 (+),score=43.72 TRINITY_DN7517_c0_g1_i1:56-523(+)
MAAVPSLAGFSATGTSAPSVALRGVQAGGAVGSLLKNATSSLSPTPPSGRVPQMLRELGSGSCNVKLTVDGETKEFDTSADSQKIHPFCEEQGIQFSCIEGTCGTCVVDVNKGGDLLNSLTEPENAFFAGDAGNRRLACQAQIKKGCSGEVECEK